MARTQSDLLGRLVDKGEEALQRVAEAPATGRLLESVAILRTRVDEMQKRLRGLDALERRVAALERRVEQLSAKPAPARKPAAKAPAKPAAKAGAKKPA